MIELLKRIRTDWNSPYRRPIWQIAILLPLYPTIWLSRKYVDFWDENTSRSLA
jgi:hypothetical protein